MLILLYLSIIFSVYETFVNKNCFFEVFGFSLQPIYKYINGFSSIVAVSDKQTNRNRRKLTTICHLLRNNNKTLFAFNFANEMYIPCIAKCLYWRFHHPRASPLKWDNAMPSTRECFLFSHSKNWNISSPVILVYFLIFWASLWKDILKS